MDHDGERASGLRVGAARQHDSGGKLESRPIRLKPDRREQIANDASAAYVVGNEYLGPVATCDPQPFATLAGMGLAADPLMKLGAKRGIPAYGPPTDVRSFKTLVPRSRLAESRKRKPQGRKPNDGTEQQ
jgi:hypothetical protein